MKVDGEDAVTWKSEVAKEHYEVVVMKKKKVNYLDRRGQKRQGV